MTALWRPIPPALTRSTPLAGSASWPQRSSSWPSTSASSTPCAATAASALLTIFAAVLLVLGVVFTNKAREIPATGPAGLQVAHSEPLKIEVTGQQWLWRYEYPNEAFSYYKLVVPVDTAVELNLVSTDVVHTWDVPELAGKRDAVPGKNDKIFFRANEEGVYDGQAATLSGQAYAAMRTEVDVVSPEEYENFIKTQKTEIQAAQDRVVGLIKRGEVP
jgi:heme/copper-type cytochrome/quinol oxidase subunit 2